MTDTEDIARRSVKASESLALELVEHIVTANLPEGSLLPHEKEMAEQFGVGRSTVREALRLLETRGVVRIRPGPGGGPVIRRPRAVDYSRALELALQFEHGTLRDVIGAREDIGPLTARLAAQRVNDEQIARFEQALLVLEESLDDNDTFSEAARHLEALIGEASGSLVVRLVVDSIAAILWDTIAPLDYPRERRDSVARALHGIVRAIESGDVGAAENQMRRYIRSAAQYWSTLLPDLMSMPVRWRA